jgi:hypothetical protein
VAIQVGDRSGRIGCLFSGSHHLTHVHNYIGEGNTITPLRDYRGFHRTAERAQEIQ